ncbi:MAG: alpha-amylase, partial [Glaciecola sp.]
NQGSLTTTIEPLSFVLLKADQVHKGSEIFDVKMSEKYTDNERVFLPVNLSFGSQQALQVADVSFYAVDESGAETFLSNDDTSPYRAVLLPEQLEGVTQLKVIVKDSSENEMSKTFKL